MNTPLVLGIVVGYFLLMFAIGWWAQRKTESAKEFLVAGQSLGFFVMAIATFSSIQSGWGMVGSTGTTSSWGPQAIVGSALLIPLGFALAWFLLGARLNRAARAHQIYSVPDVIKQRYGSKSAHLTMSVAMVLGSIAYMTAQVSAIGVITAMLLGTSVAVGAWIGSVIVAVYTIAGGMLAAVWTDLIQGILMIVMSVGLFFVALRSAGGWDHMLDTITSAEPQMLELDGIKPAAYIFGYAIMIVFGAAAQPQLVTKFLMLRDKKELQWGAAVSGMAYAVTTLFSLGVGLAMRSMIIEGKTAAPSSIDATATDFLANHTSAVVGGLAMTALLAAIMSSASSFITIGAAAVVRDFVGGLGVTIRNELLWSRVASGGIVLASLLFTLYLSQIIYLLGAIGWAAFGASIFGPLVLGLFWKRATAAATIAAVVVALGANLLVTIATTQGWVTLPTYFYVGGASIVGSIFLFIVVSYATSTKSDTDRFDALYGAGSDSEPAATTVA